MLIDQVGGLFLSKSNCKVGGFINHFLKSEAFFFSIKKIGELLIVRI